MWYMEAAVNLTLSIDQRLLEKARRTAVAMGLSLNEMIRQYLERIAGEGDKAAAFEELRELCTSRGGHSAGRTWRREELHRA